LFELLTQFSDDIGDDEHMTRTGSRHREHFAIHVLAFVWSLPFARQIFFWGQSHFGIERHARFSVLEVSTDNIAQGK
jgi:hypothetical protein